MSRPVASAAREPKYWAMMVHTIWAIVMTSMTAPTRRMYDVSPFATPLSMMSAFSVGRYNMATVAMSCSITTASMCQGYRERYVRMRRVSMWRSLTRR